MAGYQLDFWRGIGYGTTGTFAGIRNGLWKAWNDGNWHAAVKNVNALVGELARRVNNMVPVAQQDVPQGKFYFVNVSVTEDDLPKIDELFPTPDVTFDLLTGVLLEGLKVSFAVNARNNMTICSLSDRREGSDTFGACLTGGADGWYTSLCVCLYKYTALLHGDLGEGEKGGGPRQRIM